MKKQHKQLIIIIWVHLIEQWMIIFLQ